MILLSAPYPHPILSVLHRGLLQKNRPRCAMQTGIPRSFACCSLLLYTYEHQFSPANQAVHSIGPFGQCVYLPTTLAPVFRHLAPSQVITAYDFFKLIDFNCVCFLNVFHIFPPWHLFITLIIPDPSRRADAYSIYMQVPSPQVSITKSVPARQYSVLQHNQYSTETITKQSHFPFPDWT